MDHLITQASLRKNIDFYLEEVPRNQYTCIVVYSVEQGRWTLTCCRG